MGPQILFDKSALQGLSRAELGIVNRYYYVVYAPVLFMEILGDLKKFSDPEDCKKEVAKIADKVSPIDSIFSAHYRDLVRGNLFGYSVEMAGRPLVLGGQDIVDSTGKRGVFLDEEPEREALRRWDAGEFSEAEHVLAERWRSSTRSMDLEGLRNKNRNFPRLKSMEEVRRLSLLGCAASERQQANLELVMADCGMVEQDQDTVLRRWRYLGKPPIKLFAPYADYCIQVLLAFTVGLVSGVIPPRSTNRIDMEYALYLPFCLAFCSEDKFLKSFIPCFLRQNQDFIGGMELKKDLAELAQHPQSYGSYPPDLPHSFTNRIWGKHMKPRDKRKPMKMTPERNKKIMEKLKPMLDAIEAARRKKGKAL